MLDLSGDTQLKKLGAQLLPSVGAFFKDCSPITPSILHGVSVLGLEALEWAISHLDA